MGQLWSGNSKHESKPNISMEIPQQPSSSIGVSDHDLELSGHDIEPLDRVVEPSPSVLLNPQIKASPALSQIRDESEVNDEDDKNGAMDAKLFVVRCPSDVS